MPHAAAPRRRKLVSAGRLLLAPFPEDVEFLVFALVEGGNLGRFGISETGSVVSLRFSK